MQRWGGLEIKGWADKETRKFRKEDEVTRQKKKRWQELDEEFGRITDAVGMPIDEDIKRTVVGLNALGFVTDQSCEGHLNAGEGYPWVRFEVPEAVKAAEDTKTWWKNEEQLGPIREASRSYRQRLRELLVEFYEGRKVTNPRAKLVVQDWDNIPSLQGMYLLVPVGRKELDEKTYKKVGKEWKKDLRSETEKEIDLIDSRKEVREFAEFLRDKYIYGD